MLSSSMQPLQLAERRQLDRVGPLALIVLLHIGLFYSLRSGLPQPPATTIEAPKELFATLITPAPAAQPAMPRPAPQKPVPQPPKAASTPAIAKTSPTPQPASSQPSPVAASNPPPAAASTAPATPAAAAPTAAPAPAAPATPKTITSGVEYIQPPSPEYPPMSKRLGEQGKVVLRVLVNEKGRPERIDLHKSSGSARLDEAGRQAVQHTLFKPHTEDGRAVAVYAIVPINFDLNN